MGPRGLGGSRGTVMFNSPDLEGRDVSAWIDFAAAQRETLLDSAGDAASACGAQAMAVASSPAVAAGTPDPAAMISSS